MKTPFEWIAVRARVPLFWGATFLSALIMVSLQVLGGPLQSSTAPAGIVSYELAGSLERASTILESWDANARMYAGLNLGLDYLFLFAYASAIGLGCSLIGSRLLERRRALGRFGQLLGWGLLLAAALDALENYALIRLLLGSTASYWPILAQWAAIPKFMLVLSGLAYVLAGWAFSQLLRGDQGPG